MASTHRSLRHEYELYVEREIENYKDSIPRNALLSIGDEAVATLGANSQFALTEMLLCDEVDRLIRRRLRIPAYDAWRRRRLRMLEKYRRPEHWGMEPDAPVVRVIDATPDQHVLVAGDPEGPALYLAAHGCDVTALGTTEDVVERVVNAAEAAGLASRFRGFVTDLGHFAPDGPLTAVVCAPNAFDGLSPEERSRVIAVLQSATRDGGVHLVETLVAGQNAITLSELRTRYSGWQISVERDDNDRPTFLARKAVA